MRIDKQPIACCYLGELRQRQAFLLHDLYTQEPIVSRARGADRIESNRKMALSETSRSQQQLSISSEYQRQAPFHTRPGSISNAFNAITKVESATPSNTNGYNPVVTIYLSATAVVHLGIITTEGWLGLRVELRH